MGSSSKDHEKISCYLESENMDALISIYCSALQHLHRQNFSPRGFVFPDRADTLDRWPGLRRTGLRSRFPVRPSSMLQEERPLESRISRLIPTLSSRALVFHDRLNTLDRRPSPNSLRHASLRSQFPMRPSCMLQEERPHKLRISRLIPALSSRG